MQCFACCPPIRPKGYDHYPFRSSLRRLFIDSTALIKKGVLPQKEMLGFFCPGLGFLDKSGQKIGCLLHPLQNQGRDLRVLTGYQPKCARESCPASRAYAVLSAEDRLYFRDLCLGMDSFSFSSPGQNPVMRLLNLGPLLARLVFKAGPFGLAEMDSWACLGPDLPPAEGWFLAGLAGLRGKQLLWDPDLPVLLKELNHDLLCRLEPLSPRDGGEPLNCLTNEWEARFWRHLTGRNRVVPAELENWRAALNRILI